MRAVLIVTLVLAGLSCGLGAIAGVIAYSGVAGVATSIAWLVLAMCSGLALVLLLIASGLAIARWSRRGSPA